MNGKLQTSNPDIYAVGDVAAFPLQNYGLNKMFRQEHVANCRQSAKHAGVTTNLFQALCTCEPAKFALQGHMNPACPKL